MLLRKFAYAHNGVIYTVLKFFTHNAPPLVFLLLYTRADNNSTHLKEIICKEKKLEEKTNELPEIVIPKGYSVDEILNTENDMGDEEPIYAEEVKVKFER